MTPDEATFIEAIADAPDDPAPRIVFADWLLERGDPRGEYVRLDHEVRHGNASATLKKRAAKLVERELARIGARASFGRDGLLAVVEVPLAELLAHADRLFSLGPIHRLRVTQATRETARLATFEPLRWAFGLELRAAWMTPADATSLAASPHLHRLRTLDIARNPLGADGVATLAAALPMLETLDASRTSLDRDLAPLVALVPRLRTLALGGNELSIEAVARILDAGGKLAALNLSHQWLGLPGAGALARATHLTKLRSLALDNTSIDDEALGVLVEAPHLARLAHLSLKGNSLGSEGAALLGLRTTFPRLKTLALDGNYGIATGRRAELVAQFPRA